MVLVIFSGLACPMLLVAMAGEALFAAAQATTTILIVSATGAAIS
jgi:hypothetical protein